MCGAVSFVLRPRGCRDSTKIRKPSHDIVEAPHARETRQTLNTDRPDPRLFPPAPRPPPSSPTQRAEMLF